MTTPSIEHNLPQRERHLLSEQAPDALPRLVLRTGTRIDAGRWLGRPRLWLCITDEQIILLCAAKRQFFETAKIAECADSYYSHPTGQLVLEPIDTLTHKHVALSPANALRVLGLIDHINNQTPTSTTTTHTTENTLA